MSQRKLHTVLYRAMQLVCIAGACAWGLFAASGADSSAQWKTSDNLTDQLEGEWYSLGILKHEIMHVEDFIATIRVCEVYPPSITHLTDESLVLVDKKIEAVEKNAQALSATIGGFSASMVDAMSILRTMVAQTPVEEMRRVLEKGHVLRVSEMLSVKHSIDTLWLRTGLLLDSIGTSMGIPVTQNIEQKSAQSEFYDILQANVGNQNENYVNKIVALKGALLKRATPLELVVMFRTDLHNAKMLYENKKYKEALSSMQSMRSDYPAPLMSNEYKLLTVSLHFALGQYDSVIEYSKYMPTDTSDAIQVLVYRIQSLYMLKEYRKIRTLGDSLDIAKLKGKLRNLIIWISLESGCALREYEDLSEMAGLCVTDAEYNLEVMHALGRICVARNDLVNAASVFERATHFRAYSSANAQIMGHIELSLAQVQYELKNYQKALPLFFGLLKNETAFDEALFGIIWCYINTGEFEKAEETLRKLVNQHVGSPREAEAILLLAKRLSAQADFSWKRYVTIEREQQRLRDLLSMIALKKQADTTGTYSAKAMAAEAELLTLLAKNKAQNIEGYEQIKGYYAKSSDIASLVKRYYQNGTFQEQTLSSTRERLLYRLDSLVMIVDARKSAVVEQKFAQSRADIDCVKDIVSAAELFDAEVALNAATWEKDYIDFQKEQNRVTDKSLAKQAEATLDTARTAQIQKERRVLGLIMDSLLLRQELLFKTRTPSLMRTCTNLLAGHLKPADEAYIRYHLGELLYSVENDRYVKEYAQFENTIQNYDSLLAAYRANTTNQKPEKPLPPRLVHSNAMGQFKRVIDQGNNDSLIAPSLYSLAWCYNDIGQSDSALACMNKLVAVGPQSRYASQAYMFMGEHAFEKGDLAKAASLYQLVMKYPESKWFEDALYKFAWTQYRLSNPEKAISSFLALVDLGSKTSGKSLLESESMDYIAISFSEADITGEKGLARAARFIQRFGDAEKGTKILHRMATVYQEQGRLEVAEKAYTTLLSMFPRYQKNAAVEKELLAIRVKNAQTNQSIDLKIAYYQKYNRNGAWARAQTDTVIRRQADSLSSDVLYDGAIAAHQRALSGNDTALYGKASRVYEEFVAAYPLSVHANECQYNVAEIMFSLGNYERAAEEYITVSSRYPDSRYKEIAAWNAIVASQNLLKQEEKVRKQ